MWFTPGVADQFARPGAGSDVCSCGFTPLPSPAEVSEQDTVDANVPFMSVLVPDKARRFGPRVWERFRCDVIAPVRTNTRGGPGPMTVVAADSTEEV
jgi:hypothetical protein